MSQKVVYDAPCVETLLYAKYLRIPIRTFRDLRVRTDGNNIEDLVSTEVENIYNFLFETIAMHISI